MTENRYEDTAAIICPHCGEEQNEPERMGEGEHECDECGLQFTLGIVVRYSTWKISK